jgi:hypothetical protein
MGKTGSLYTRQCFMDVARRRAREARVLLDYPTSQKQRDGAKKPQRSLAEPLIQSAECLVDWMRALPT